MSYRYSIYKIDSKEIPTSDGTLQLDTYAFPETDSPLEEGIKRMFMNYAMGDKLSTFTVASNLSNLGPSKCDKRSLKEKNIVSNKMSLNYALTSV
jgi:hypothetical protein